MARTINHMPYDVQIRIAWGDTEPTADIDPLTGDEWESLYWKGAAADRNARSVGTHAHIPGLRIGGNNPAKHRAYMGRPRIVPTVDEYDYDEAAEVAYDAAQRALDEYAAWGMGA